MKHTFKLSKRKTLEKKKERTKQKDEDSRVNKEEASINDVKVVTGNMMAMWALVHVFVAFVVFFLCIFVPNDSHLSAGSLDICQYS